VIEIHLDGKPVTKLQAARAVALVNGQSVDVGEPNASGWIEHGITVYHRHRTLDGDQPAQVHWASYTGVSAADARMFAEMITLGAEVAELAEMIAAEQVVEFTSDSRMDVIAPCLKPGEHAYVPDGKRVQCDRLEHHKPGLVGSLVEDAHDDSPVPVTGKVIRQVDEETVEVLWGDLKFWPNPGHGSREPIDALRPAREQAGA
jgi:hypothetical protein